MMHSNFRQTTFEIQKIKNVVNVGRSSAFQIYCTPGEMLGQFKSFSNPELQQAANESQYESNSPVPWYRNALGA
jgi:hypothetical protein